MRCFFGSRAVWCVVPFLVLALFEGASASAQPHSADQNGDYRVEVSELLRVIQFFNSAGYHCEAGTEDGYDPGAGSQACTPHNSDYDGAPDWVISLSELLRLTQLFNGCRYVPDSLGEDGFVPGDCIWHVKPGGMGVHGKTWGDAFGSIQEAVEAAASNNDGEVWVAEGAYSGQTIHMRERVRLYGGFAGTEGVRDSRDWSKRPTIIDGGRRRCCVIGAPSALLDGFVVQNGKSNSGGGMFNSADQVTVANCVFSGNYANVDGGGIFTEGFHFTIMNSVFTENTARLSDGGGVYSIGSDTRLIDCNFFANTAFQNGGGLNAPFFNLSNCTFSENTARYGGGLFSSIGPSILTACTFNGNSASFGGGGICDSDSASTLTACAFHANSASQGGAVFYDLSSPAILGCSFWGNAAVSGGGAIYCHRASPLLLNCVLSGNKSGDGGGMYNCAESVGTLINCTFFMNSADFKGGGMYSLYSSATVTNCVMWRDGDAPSGVEIYNSNSTTEVSFSGIWNGYVGEGNIDADPLFVDAVNGDLRLQAGSPCIDAGTDVGAPETDILGVLRPQGAGYDMGAYEFAGK